MTKRKRLPRAPVETSGSIVPVGTPGAVVLQEYTYALTPIEEKVAKGFVLCNNATKAYIDATNYQGKRTTARVLAWEIVNRPHVLQRIRQYESAAAAATVIDYAAILDHDRQIVEGYKHADEVSWREFVCCRYCYGVEHKYQWRDFEEYLRTLQTANDENTRRADVGKREMPLPKDDGGYGFDVQAEPSLFCPRCEGRGEARDMIADTTKLQGPARAIVKGIKVTNTGTEVLLHDIDKAKERLLRAGGYFESDAAGIAKAAAAGAGAGAAAAIAAAKAVENMSVDEAQKLYLDMA